MDKIHMIDGTKLLSMLCKATNKYGMFISFFGNDGQFEEIEKAAWGPALRRD